MKFKVRKAKVSDLDLIDELYFNNSIDEVKLQFPKKKKSDIVKEFKNAEKRRKKGFKEDIKKSNHIWVIAYTDEEVIGFAQGIVEKSYGGKMGLIEKIYLNKKYRGKGIGAKLGKILMNKMKKRDVDFYESRLFASNLASLKLNERLGLKPFSLRMRKNV